MLINCVKPGFKLAGASASENADRLIFGMENALIKANICLLFYLGVKDRNLAAQVTEEAWNYDRRHRKNAEASMLYSPWPSNSEKNYALWKAEAGVIACQSKFEEGTMPSTHALTVPHIHAQGYLDGLDEFERCLFQLVHDGHGGTIVKNAHDCLAAALPTLRNVRDSFAHMNERLVGKAQKKSIQAQSLEPYGISGSPLVVAMIFNDHILCTTKAGNQETVPISENVLLKMKAVLEDVFNAFEWDGEPRPIVS